MPTKTRVRQ